MIDSCSMLEIRKKSSLRNVKRFTLGFLISKYHTDREFLLFQLVSLDIFFNIRFPPDAPNLHSKLKLRSHPKTIFFLL